MKRLVLTVVSILILVSFGIAVAGKPPKDIPGIIAFADDPTVRLRGDGTGPYSAEMSRYGSGIFLEDAGRPLYVDFSRCVSETCERPFLAMYAHTKNFMAAVKKDMQPDDVAEAPIVQFWLERTHPLEPEWHVFCHAEYVRASDQDDDGVVDRWEIVSTEDSLCLLYKSDKKTAPHIVGIFEMPFTITFDAN